jgi:uncharacterized membrane protein SpoIIM required for sporulation
VDVDAFVATHRAEWDRLGELVARAGRPARLSGAEVDELITLYQRAATHLSLVQSRSPDPQVVARLSRLVNAARHVIAGATAPAWRQLLGFFLTSFPAAAYRSRRWWIGTAVVSLLLALAVGIWVSTHPDVQRSLLPPSDVRQLVDHGFAGYYRDHPARDFASHVWLNNVWVSAQALIGGLTVGLLTLYALLANMLNLGVVGGYMVAAGRTGQFYGLLAPHGVLELSAVFLAAGTGLRLAWTVVDPGPRPRAQAIAEETRGAVTISLGLVVVLATSGIIEAFVTPSSLPTAARIGVGLVAEAVFLGYVAVFGRRAALAGETGDLAESLRGDTRPVSG